MKIFLTFLTALFISSNASAINFSDSLKSISKDSTKKITKNLEKKMDKIVKKYEGEIKDEVEKYKKEVKNAQKSLEKLKGIKDKAESYIRIAKIVVAALSSGILVLLFIIWRIWRNVVNMRRLVQNASNYKEFDKRLKALEKKA